jgi:hypothetical protein
LLIVLLQLANKNGIQKNNNFSGSCCIVTVFFNKNAHWVVAEVGIPEISYLANVFA